MNIQVVLKYSLALSSLACFFSIFFDTNSLYVEFLVILTTIITLSRLNSIIPEKIGFVDDLKLDLSVSLLAALLIIREVSGTFGQTLWLLSICAWLLSWLAVEKLMKVEEKRFPLLYSIGIPVLFGFWLLFFWEIITIGLEIPTVILPPPSMIGTKFLSSLDILFADFQQTFMKSVLAGYFIGCSSHNHHQKA